MTTLPPEIEKIMSEKASAVEWFPKVYRDGFKAAAEIFMKREENLMKIIQMQRATLEIVKLQTIEVNPWNVCKTKEAELAENILKQTDRMLKGEQ